MIIDVKQGTEHRYYWKEKEQDIVRRNEVKLLEIKNTVSGIKMSVDKLTTTD